jgi:hypothetical protein
MRPGAGRRPRRLSAVPAPIEALKSDAAPAAVSPVVVQKPDGLKKPVSAMWDRFAPLATAQGTLVPAMVPEFEAMCELAVLQAMALKRFRREGFTEFGLKVERSYRGLTQRLEIKMRAFRLAPMGKEIAPTAKDKPLSPLERLKLQGQNLRAVK